MKLRAVFFDGVLFLLWTFLSFYYNRVFSFNLFLSSLGAVFGLVVGISVALKQIRSLEKNGEFKVTLKTWASMLVTIIIVIPIAIYLIFSYGPRVGIPMLSFLYPSIPAIYATRITLYLNWERKHRKLVLYDGLGTTRVYAPQDLKGDNLQNETQ